MFQLQFLLPVGVGAVISRRLTRLVCLKVYGGLLFKRKVGVRNCAPIVLKSCVDREAVLPRRVMKSWSWVTSQGWYRLAGYRRQR